MRKIRLLLLGGCVFAMTLGFSPAAHACKPYNGGSCSPGACHLVAPDPDSGNLFVPYIECYY